MERRNRLPRYREAFLRLFYPSFCATCQKLLELEEEGLCLPCRENLQKLKFFPSEERIRISLTYGDEGWGLFRYDDSVKEVLHKIKFGRRRDLLRIFAEETISFLERRPQLAAYDCIVPVPLDPRRRAQRQFNPSGLLAQTLHRLLGKKLRLVKKGLLKKRSSAPQSLLGREGRRFNLNRVFRVPHPRRIRGLSVLLVDDIFTTGATFEEAAKTLKEAGAARVGIFALARALAN